MKNLLFLLLLFPMLCFAKVPLKNPIVLNDSNVLLFDLAVTESTVSDFQIKVLDLLNSFVNSTLNGNKDPIYIVMNTPGGEIEAGLNLIDFLTSIDRKFHTINLFSASMGFHIAQSLNDRYVTKTGTLMSHKARGGFSGEFPGQLDSRYNYYLKRLQHMDEQAVKRTKGKHTLESYRALIENEYWCEGKDCVEQGLADEVGNFVCDSSLTGTKIDKVSFQFFGKMITVSITRAKCPLIVGWLDVKIETEDRVFFGRTDDFRLNQRLIELFGNKIFIKE